MEDEVTQTMSSPKKPDFIQFAFSMDGAGHGHEIPFEHLPEEIKDDGLAWLHLDASRPESREWLESKLNYLDPFIINALLEDLTRPRMIEFGDGVLLILREVNHAPEAGEAETVSLRLWVDKTRVVSLSRFDVKATHQMAQKIINGKAPLNAAQFVISIANLMVNGMEHTISELNELIDTIEDSMSEKQDENLYREVVKLRKKSIIYRRYLLPQRDALDALRLADLRWMTVKHKREIHEIYNHVTRYIEDLDALRERTQIVKDEINNALSVKLNKNMYVLSILSGVFLPLSFITGLFGVNLAGMPFAGSQLAFGIFSLSLLLVGLFEIWIFKRMKLF